MWGGEWAVGEGVCVGEGCVWERWALCPSEAAGGVHLWEGFVPATHTADNNRQLTRGCLLRNVENK